LKRNWQLDELIEHFTFSKNEMRQVGIKTGETRLGFAVLFKFFQYEARFPTQKSEVPKSVIQHIAKGVGVSAVLFARYSWSGRVITYHRAQIREYFGFRENTIADNEEVIDWLCKGILLDDHNLEHLIKAVYQRFKDSKIEPPTPDRIERIIKTAIAKFEGQLFQTTLEKLPAASLPKIDSLISGIEFLDEDQGYSNYDESIMTFQEMKSDPGKLSVECALKEVRKLREIRNLTLPDNLFYNIPKKILYKYRSRAASEDLRELRRHPDPIRYTILAAFFTLSPSFE